MTASHSTGERLIEVMDGPYIINGKPRRIDTAFIQPPQGNTIYTWTDGERSGRESIDDYMAYTVELTQKYPDRLLGCFVYNPRCGPENGAEAIEFYAKEHGFKMVQLQANMHAYRPDRALDWLRPALQKCADLGLIVKLHTGDGPYSIPSEWYPLIREFPSVEFHHGAFRRADRRRVLLRAVSDGARYARTSIANRAGACNRASSNSPRCCRRTRSCTAPTRRRTSPACGCACSKCCVTNRRKV